MTDVAAPFTVARRVMSTPNRAIAVGVAIILGIAFMWFLGLGASRIDGFTRLGFMFVLVLMMLGFGGGVVLDVIRGRQGLLEVDSSGIRIKGMPRLNWPEVAEVRTEESVAFNGLQTESGTSVGVGGLELEVGKGGVRSLEEAFAAGDVSVRRRLGIVPRDSSIVPPPGLFSGFSGYVERKNRETAARIGRVPIGRAPFGIYETEMDAHLEDVVAAIRRFHEVGELSDLKDLAKPTVRS
jgi:hypothetical protein